MRILVVVLLWMVVGGCSSGSWWQSALLSGADTKQAIALEQSQDPKTCTRARGAGSYLGIEGYVDHIEARGKNVSFQDCLSAQTPGVNPVILPASRPPVP